jgi:glycosyltransferase involved in cell wall biosynthesis
VTGPIHIVHTLPDLRVGGGQTLLLENIRTLDPACFRHTVCHVRPIEEMDARFRATGARTVDLGLRRRRSEPAAILRLIRSGGWGVDIVHSNNTPEDFRFAVVLSRLRQLPLVVTLHARRGNARGAKARYEATLWRLAQPRLAGVIAVSDPVHESWAPHFRELGLPDGRLATITPALDLGRFRYPADPETRRIQRQALGIPSAARLLVNVSRLVPGKGHAFLLALVERLRRCGEDVVLALAGEGRLRSEIEGEVALRGLGGAIRLLGNVEDVPSLLAAADVFVFPSESESFGIAPLESMAAGVPVVAAELPALASFVRSGVSGLIAPQGDLETFAGHVRALLDDAALRDRITTAARHAVESDYSTEISARRMADFYAASLRRSGCRGPVADRD